MIDIFDTKKRFAVNVKSEQEALDFLEWAESEGVEIFGLDKDVSSQWKTRGQNLCYNVEESEAIDRLQIGWCYKEWYEREGYTVVKADEVEGFCESLSSSCEVSDNLTNFLIGIMGDSIGKERKRACCNCGNNKRVTTESGHCDCFCSIDGHYIGYNECFEGWCRRWRKDRKFE